jgi:hypothetical protein
LNGFLDGLRDGFHFCFLGCGLIFSGRASRLCLRPL